MNVLIIANHGSSDLAPLIKDSALCLLTVAGKPLIEHTLEAVARLSPNSTTIVASRGLNALRRYIGSGERWGLLIDVVSSRPNESLPRLRMNNKRLFLDDLLIIECNRIRGFSYQSFLDKVKQSDSKSTQYTAIANGEDAGLHFYVKSHVVSTDPPTEIEIQDASSHLISDLENYHRANMLVAAGEVPTVLTRGKERSLGLITGFMTRIHPRSIKSGRVHAGNNCRVHPSCSLTGNVVLNNGVVVDRYTSIENSLILSQTFVGENLEIKNAILCGELLIRVDTGAVVEITDRFLTAQLGESLYDAHFAEVTNRFFGVVLTVLSVPMWPIALILACIHSPRNLFIKKRFVGNKPGKPHGTKRQFSTFEFATKHGFFRRLPLTLSIAAGHIRLVGVSLCTPDELTDRIDGWETQRNHAPSGVLGPVQLYLADDSNTNEKILMDAIFAQQLGKLNSLNVCWQSIKLLFGFESEQHSNAFTQPS